MKKILLTSLILFIILLNLSGCINYSYDNELKEYNISIDKIKLDMNYEVSSIKEKVENIVMFEEYGRPDIEGSNTIIGAHSGNSDTAYFNDIHKLCDGDEINVTYNKKTYIYVVKEVIEVEDTDIDVLNNKEESMLTLLTCKIGDSSKRIVVIAVLLN